MFHFHEELEHAAESPHKLYVYLDEEFEGISPWSHRKWNTGFKYRYIHSTGLLQSTSVLYCSQFVDDNTYHLVVGTHRATAIW